MKMKLLLTKNVSKLGIVGDIVEVAPGYGRNYLVPHGLATEPTDANMRALAEARRLAEEERIREREQLQSLAERLATVEITIRAKANEDGVLYGRGSADMKSAVAAFLAGTERFLAAAGESFTGSVSLLITGDEEADAVNGTVKLLSWLDERGETPDAALVGEPTSPERLGDMVKIGRRGSLSGWVVVNGIQGHTAYPHRADNPANRLVADVLEQRWNGKLRAVEMLQGELDAHGNDDTSLSAADKAAILAPGNDFAAVWSDPRFPLLMLVLIMLIWIYQFLYESRLRIYLELSVVRTVMVVAMILYLIFFASSGNQPFIYFQF